MIDQPQMQVAELTWTRDGNQLRNVAFGGLIERREGSANVGSTQAIDPLSGTGVVAGDRVTLQWAGLAPVHGRLIDAGRTLSITLTEWSGFLMYPVDGIDAPGPGAPTEVLLTSSTPEAFAAARSALVRHAAS